MTRFSRVLEENGINHMYSSTFKTANLLVSSTSSDYFFSNYPIILTFYRLIKRTPFAPKVYYDHANLSRPPLTTLYRLNHVRNIHSIFPTRAAIRLRSSLLCHCICCDLPFNVVPDRLVLRFYHLLYMWAFRNLVLTHAE